ncbi:MAG: hypothetical protein LBG58_05030 [Planctomycetaceae bacterium]|jgi:hypothetical protein|nr:hypothetical protein [Planctomycetaceae bacterium]
MLSEILGWIVWGLAALFIILWGFLTFKRFMKKESINWAICFLIPWGIVSLLITATTNYSKFHLFWMIPLGVIFPLAILGLRLWLYFKELGSAFKKIGSAFQEIAQQMSQETELQKQLYKNPISYIDVNLDDFSHLDLDWYNHTAQEIAAETDAQFVADLECPELSQIWRHLRTFVRTLTAENGQCVFILFNIRGFDKKGILVQNAKTITIETGFSDGSFLTTSNTEGVNFEEDCEGITLNKLPIETSWQELLKLHQEAVTAKTAGNNLTVVSIKTKEEIIAAQMKQHEFRAKAKQAEWDEEDEDDIDEDDDYDDDDDDYDDEDDDDDDEDDDYDDEDDDYDDEDDDYDDEDDDYDDEDDDYDDDDDDYDDDDVDDRKNEL